MAGRACLRPAPANDVVLLKRCRWAVAACRSWKGGSRFRLARSLGPKKSGPAARRAQKRGTILGSSRLSRGDSLRHHEAGERCEATPAGGRAKRFDWPGARPNGYRAGGLFMRKNLTGSNAIELSTATGDNSVQNAASPAVMRRCSACYANGRAANNRARVPSAAQVCSASRGERVAVRG